MKQLKQIKLLRDEVEKCVRCGLCLYYCPVYAEESDENYVARGRNRLVKEIIDNHKDLRTGRRDRFSKCLLCRRCTMVCPQGIRTDMITVAARAELAKGDGLPVYKSIAFRKLLKDRKRMKLVRFGEKGKEKPGLWKAGNIVDLREFFPEIPDIGEVFFRENWLEKIAEIDDPGKEIKARIGCPVHAPSKIICLGKNYAEHAKEGGFEKPEKPLIFCKTPNTLSGPFDPIILPRSSGQIDWEVELAVIIAKQGKRIRKADAFGYIGGFTVMNDVSGREAQFSDSQWFR